MTEELKPCPFCGGKPQKRISEDNYFWIICNNCGCSAVSRTPASTEKQWNHRPEEERLQKRIEELEECGQIKNCQWKKPDSSPEETGVSSALDLLNFLSALAQCPQDYEGAADEQAESYPELARGLMLIAICVGQMRQNEQSADVF